MATKRQKRQAYLECQKAIAKRNNWPSVRVREMKRQNINKKKADARQASYMDRVYGGTTAQVPQRALKELDALMGCR